jgi:hypothetical protein
MSLEDSLSGLRSVRAAEEAKRRARAEYVAARSPRATEVYVALWRATARALRDAGVAPLPVVRTSGPRGGLLHRGEHRFEVSTSGWIVSHWFLRSDGRLSTRPSGPFTIPGRKETAKLTRGHVAGLARIGLSTGDVVLVENLAEPYGSRVTELTAAQTVTPVSDLDQVAKIDTEFAFTPDDVLLVKRQVGYEELAAALDRALERITESA